MEDIERLGDTEETGWGRTGLTVSLKLTLVKASSFDTFNYQLADRLSGVCPNGNWANIQEFKHDLIIEPWMNCWRGDVDEKPDAGVTTFPFDPRPKVLCKRHRFSCIPKH